MLRLPKHQRLARPADYRRVYQSEYWGNTRLFSFNVRPLVDKPKEPSVLGVTVSKKVSKSAVVRNQIKRQVKEQFRLSQHQLLGCELVITAKAPAGRANRVERKGDLDELWHKVLRWQHWFHKHKKTPIG